MLNFAVAFGKMGRFQSGQMGQTVNLLRHRFGGSNPSLPTFIENPRPVRTGRGFFSLGMLYKLLESSTRVTQRAASS